MTSEKKRWESWIKGAEAFNRASDASDELTRKLRQAVGAAQDYRRHRAAMVTGVVGVIVALVGVVVALGLVK